MELIAKQLHAFMQAYIDCLNSMYNGAVFTNTGMFKITTRYVNTIPYRYASIDYNSPIYVRSDGIICYMREDLFFQEIPTISDDNLMIFDDKTLVALPILQMYQRTPIVDLVNRCYRDVDDLIHTKYHVNILHTFEELHNAFLDFGFDDESPDYIYDTQYDSMQYYLSYFPLNSIFEE